MRTAMRRWCTRAGLVSTRREIPATAEVLCCSSRVASTSSSSVGAAMPSGGTASQRFRRTVADPVAAAAAVSLSDLDTALAAIDGICDDDLLSGPVDPVAYREVLQCKEYTRFVGSFATEAKGISMEVRSRTIADGPHLPKKVFTVKLTITSDGSEAPPPQHVSGKGDSPVAAFNELVIGMANETFPGGNVLDYKSTTTMHAPNAGLGGCTVHRLLRSLAMALYAQRLTADVTFAHHGGESYTVSVVADNDGGRVLAVVSGEGLLRLYREALRQAFFLLSTASTNATACEKAAGDAVPETAALGLTLQHPNVAERWQAQHPVVSATALLMMHHRARLTVSTAFRHDAKKYEVVFEVSSRNGALHEVCRGTGASKLEAQLAATHRFVEHNFPELFPDLAPFLGPRPRPVDDLPPLGAPSSTVTAPAATDVHQAGQFFLRKVAAASPPHGGGPQQRVVVRQMQVQCPDGQMGGWVSEVVLIPALADGAASQPTPAEDPLTAAAAGIAAGGTSTAKASHGVTVGEGAHAKKNDSLAVAYVKALVAVFPQDAAPFIADALRKGLIRMADLPPAAITLLFPAKVAAAASSTLVSALATGPAASRPQRRQSKSRLSLLRRAVAAAASERGAGDLIAHETVEDTFGLDGTRLFEAAVIVAPAANEGTKRKGAAATKAQAEARDLLADSKHTATARHALLAQYRALSAAYGELAARAGARDIWEETEKLLAESPPPVVHPTSITGSVLDLLAWAYGCGAAVAGEFLQPEGCYVAYLHALTKPGALESQQGGLVTKKKQSSSPAGDDSNGKDAAAAAPLVDRETLLEVGFGDNEEEAIANALLRTARAHFPTFAAALPSPTDGERRATIGPAHAALDDPAGSGEYPALRGQQASTTAMVDDGDDGGPALPLGAVAAPSDIALTVRCATAAVVAPPLVADLEEGTTRQQQVNGVPTAVGRVAPGALGAMEQAFLEAGPFISVVARAIRSGADGKWTVKVQGAPPPLTPGRAGAPIAKQKTPPRTTASSKGKKRAPAADATPPVPPLVFSNAVTAEATGSLAFKALVDAYDAFATNLATHSPLGSASRAELPRKRRDEWNDALQRAFRPPKPVVSTLPVPPPGNGGLAKDTVCIPATATPMEVAERAFVATFGLPLHHHVSQQRNGRQIFWRASIGTVVTEPAMPSPSAAPAVVSGGVGPMLDIRLTEGVGMTKRQAVRSAVVSLLHTLFPELLLVAQSHPSFLVDATLPMPTAAPPVAPDSKRTAQKAAAHSAKRAKGAAAAREAAFTVEDLLRKTMLAAPAPGELRIEEQRLSGGFIVRLFRAPLLKTGELDLLNEEELLQEKGIDRKKLVSLACYKVMQHQFAPQLRQALTQYPDLARSVL